MDNSFSSQILSDKLTKLNSSQQSIESLSKWCISHCKKAKQVVETWEKMFSGSAKEQRISFLYLANDILQNSRRKGSEFVNEFWKHLPGALKTVNESGDDHGKTVVKRLVNIWDERKVFGSRGRVLKDEMLGKGSSPLLENSGRSTQPIKIVKKDVHSIRIKLAIGAMPEKIVTAFQSVHDEHFNEEAMVSKCNAAVDSMKMTEKDIEDAFVKGNFEASSLVAEIEEQEATLKQCVKQIEGIAAARESLIIQLKEALDEQESKLEITLSQLQIARASAEHANTLKQRLTSALSLTSNFQPVDTPMVEHKLSKPAAVLQLQQPPPPVTSFSSSYNTAEEQHKKTAAEVAAKLAASASSEQILNAVLSTFVAEAASKNGDFKTESFSTSPLFPANKRPKTEKSAPVLETGRSYVGHTTQQQLPSVHPLPSQAPIASFQQMVHMNPKQSPFPPSASLQLPLPIGQQYSQASGSMVGVVPYVYGSNSLPPPPVQSHMLADLVRPGTQQPAGLQPLLPQQLQQQAVTTGFNQPSGMSFFRQPTTAPVPRHCIP